MWRALVTTTSFLVVLAAFISGAWGQSVDPIAQLPPGICPSPDEFLTGTPSPPLSPPTIDLNGADASASTPEPTAIGLAAIGGFTLLCQRRRRAKYRRSSLL